MTTAERTLRILWATKVPEDVCELAEYSARDFASLLPEHVDTLVFRFYESDSLGQAPGRITPWAFVSDAEEGVGITIMLDPGPFDVGQLHSAILRAIVDLHFDERPEHWWPALSFLLANTRCAESYLLPPTGITGVEQIYRRIMRERLNEVLDLLAGEISLLRGDYEFAPLWNRKNVPQGARIVAMMEYDFNPIDVAGADFLNHVDEKGWTLLTEEWVEVQRRQRS